MHLIYVFHENLRTHEYQSLEATHLLRAMSRMQARNLLILAFSLILSQYVLYWTRYDAVYPHFDLLPTMCYYVTGPLLYVYFLNLYKREVNFNFALHFLPAFLMLISNVIFILTDTLRGM